VNLGLREHPEAAAELDAAVEWYEAREPGLGIGLIEQIEAAQRRVLDVPNAWPRFPGWDRLPLVRTAKVEVYPYRIVYVVRSQGIVVLAYAHTSRQPGYWRHRHDS